MKEVDILYSYYYSADGKKINIGGIQTYIAELAKIIVDLGYFVNIYQYATVEFEKKVSENIIVKGIVVTGTIENKNKMLIEKVRQNSLGRQNLLIYATDSMIPIKTEKRGIAIQHGISWDIPRTDGVSFLKGFISKAKNAFKMIKRIENADTIVCVDYNFLNWYRALVARVQSKVIVIPNFAKSTGENRIMEEEKDLIRIIFARRFFEYRGTRLFAEVIVWLSKEYNNIDITIAGEGPDEKWLREKLENCSRVHFIKYDSNDSLKIHLDKDIAIVPTIGSEGTSLSLLEAMSAKCAVVCTNVGGMTNIVIDHYNGLMINPDKESLYCALKELIENKKLRKELAEKARETVNMGFSYKIWKKRWSEVIKEMVHRYENE